MDILDNYDDKLNYTDNLQNEREIEHDGDHNDTNCNGDCSFISDRIPKENRHPENIDHEFLFKNNNNMDGKKENIGQIQK